MVKLCRGVLRNKGIFCYQLIDFNELSQNAVQVRIPKWMLKGPVKGLKSQMKISL